LSKVSNIVFDLHQSPKGTFAQVCPFHVYVLYGSTLLVGKTCLNSTTLLFCQRIIDCNSHASCTCFVVDDIMCIWTQLFFPSVTQFCLG